MTVIAPEHVHAVWPSRTPPPPEAHVRRTLFVLDPASGVADFVATTLPGLLRELSRETPRVATTQRGRITGRPDFAATARVRAASQGDATLFVCREPSHTRDTPENLLLAATLAGWQATLAALPRAVRIGVLCAPEAAHPLAPIVTVLAHGLRTALAHSALRELDTSRLDLPTALWRASRSRTAGYRALAELHAHEVTKTSEPLAALVARTVIVPAPIAGHAPWTALLCGAIGAAPTPRRTP